MILRFQCCLAIDDGSGRWGQLREVLMGCWQLMILIMGFVPSIVIRSDKVNTLSHMRHTFMWVRVEVVSFWSKNKSIRNVSFLRCRKRLGSIGRWTEIL